MAKATAKKKWFQLMAPKLFNEKFIGETPSLESKTLNGKAMNVNLSILTEDMRKQNTEISLVVSGVEGDKVKTDFIGLRVVPTSIKRLVRKGRTRLDQTISVITKDEKVVTIKMLLVARNIIQGSVKSGLQTETKRFIVKKVSSLTYDEISELVIYGRLGKELKEKMSKIYPLRICDVREFKLERFVKAMELRRIKSDVAKQLKKQIEPVEDVEDAEKEINETEVTPEKEVEQVKTEETTEKKVEKEEKSEEVKVEEKVEEKVSAEEPKE